MNERTAPFDLRKLEADLARFGRAADESRLLASTCGNASILASPELMAISASGSRLAALNPDEVSLIALGDGAHQSGPRASMEAELHRLAYGVRPEAGAVLHCQSPAATVLACMAEPPENLDFIPEIPAYVRDVAYVPYNTPGSDELAFSVRDALKNEMVTVVQMENHGQVIVGKTWEDAIRSAVFFELAAWMYLQNPDLRRIPEEAAAVFRYPGSRA